MALIPIGPQIRHQRSRIVQNLRDVNHVVDTVNLLRKLDFDSSQFIVQKYGDGIHIGINNDIVSDSFNEEYHLQGVVTQSNTASTNGASMVIHGGIWKQYANSQVIKTDLTTDAGTSEHYEDVYTLTDIYTSGYLIGELDDPLNPTTFEIRKVDDYPLDDAIINDVSNSCSAVVLGYCNVNSTSNTLTYEQYWTGGDIMSVAVIPDGNRDKANTGYNTIENRPTDGALQIYDTSNSGGRTKTLVLAYESPATKPIKTLWVPTSSTPRDCGVALSEAYPAGSESALNTGGLARADHYHHISDSDHASNADTADYADEAGTVVVVPSHAHTIHTFGTDDHATAPDKYMVCALNGTNTRNNCAEEMRIADHNSVSCIAPAYRQLLSRNDGTTPIICWDTEGATPPWTIAFDAENIWDRTQLNIGVTGSAIIKSSTAGDLSFGTNVASFTTTYLYTGSISINGETASDVADWFTKGILTGTVVEKEWQDVDPTDKVLVRV